MIGLKNKSTSLESREPVQKKSGQSINVWVGGGANIFWKVDEVRENALWSLNHSKRYQTSSDDFYIFDFLSAQPDTPAVCWGASRAKMRPKLKFRSELCRVWCRFKWFDEAYRPPRKKGLYSNLQITTSGLHYKKIGKIMKIGVSIVHFVIKVQNLVQIIDHGFGITYWSFKLYLLYVNKLDAPGIIFPKSAQFWRLTLFKWL